MASRNNIIVATRVNSVRTAPAGEPLFYFVFRVKQRPRRLFIEI